MMYYIMVTSETGFERYVNEDGDLTSVYEDMQVFGTQYEAEVGALKFQSYSKSCRVEVVELD